VNSDCITEHGFKFWCNTSLCSGVTVLPFLLCPPPPYIRTTLFLFGQISSSSCGFRKKQIHLYRYHRHLGKPAAFIQWMSVIFIYLQSLLLCNSLLDNDCQANFTLTLSDLCAVVFYFSLLDYCILLCELFNSSCTSTRPWPKWSPGSTWALGDKYRQAQMHRAYLPPTVNSGPSVRVAVWLCFTKTVFNQVWASPIMPTKFCCSGNAYYWCMKTSVRCMGAPRWFGWNMAME